MPEGVMRSASIASPNGVLKDRCTLGLVRRDAGHISQVALEDDYPDGTWVADESGD